MVHLKDINLTEAEEQKQKVINMAKELQKEKDKLRDILVALNLDYYGTSPVIYYTSLKKEYITDDGYAVKIEQGVISISKKIQENLVVIWSENFNEDTTFSLFKCSFRYNSGRYIGNSIAIDEIAKKHKNEIKRIQEILETEQIYNPFTEYSSFYSFVDFYK